MEDNQIIELYQARDEAAIENTQTKYGAYMNTIAYNVLRNHQDSEECVSDACMKTWNAIPPAVPNCLKAFVGRITRNTALDMYDSSRAKRRGGGQVAVALDELTDCVAAFGGDPSEHIEAAELAETINGMLDNLSPAARRIFVLRYYYLYSVGEIADKLGMTRGTVSTSLSRSRAVLAAFLEKI